MNPKNNRHWPQSGLAFGALLLLCVSVQGFEPKEVQADIDHLLAGLGRKVNLEERIERVAQHGTNAVPLLIERYGQSDPEQRWLLAACLCQLPTVGSLDLLRSILRSHEDQRASSQVIRRFPLEYEDQITMILVDLLRVARLSFDAEERLRKMIARKPSRAGDLVSAMDLADKSMTGKNWSIGEILADVSGYKHTWCCFGPPGTDWGAWQRDFWTKWWIRNKDKEPFDWLAETLQSDLKNGSRQAEALQVLGSLKDPRSAAFLLEALDSESERVRYWAVIGLKRLDGSLDPTGYRWETFQKEQAPVISQLKQKFSNQEHNPNRAQPRAAPSDGPATPQGNPNVLGQGRP
ncbi:MAG: HEAT repeat domain-containing protein [Verrucomicrobia bacterium]|nr:HEAT repeat domain-containing protein [Verrucomicrobiota bacterium]